MEKLRIGIIGMGKMGLLHAGILNSLPDTKVIAITDTEDMIIKFIQKNIPNFAVYHDYKEMIEKSSPDIVYITTPVSSHIPIATFCVEKGLPIFIEKPLGKTYDECFSLCKLIEEKKIVSMVGFYLRYSDTFQKAKELIVEGRVGQIKSVISSVYQTQILSKNAGWRFKKDVSGGGVLIDLGSHLIDLLLWYFGKMSTLEGTIKSEFTKEVEDSASYNIIFENGIQCSFIASWTRPKYRLQETTIEIEGTRGRLKVNEDYVKIYYENSDKENSLTFYRQDLSKGVPIDIGGPEYTREDVDFIKCVRSGKKTQLDVVDSNYTQRVIDKMYEAAKKNGGKVTLV